MVLSRGWWLLQVWPAGGCGPLNSPYDRIPPSLKDSGYVSGYISCLVTLQQSANYLFFMLTDIYRSCFII